MTGDSELLRQYAGDRSETAFTSLVERYLNLVYAAALREVGGDVHLAKDVTQGVFTTFVRKASSLIHHPTLAGWLYRTTRHVALKAMRSERRRHAREQEAYAMQENVSPEASAHAEEIRPVLEAAMRHLNEQDREVVLRRFFADQAFPEIGAALKLSEHAARMRVERALEKIRIALSRRGITSTTAALSAVLTTQATVVAPAGLAAAVSSAAVAATASGSALTFLTLMSMTKFQAGIVGALVLGGALGTVLQQQTHAKLQDELAGVRQQNERLPRLRRENLLLAQATPAPNEDRQAELVRLRDEAAALEKQLAEVTTAEAAPALARGMVPANAWKNVGRATPGEAFETLQWAKAAVDFVALGRMIAFSPGDRAKAEDVFARLPENVRVKLELTSPEEMVGLVCAMSDPIVGAQVKQALRGGADEMTLRTRIQREGRTEPRDVQFRNSGDGWQWVVARNELEHGLNEIAKRFLPGYPLFLGGK